MEGLAVSSWKDWEVLCAYFMSEKVKRVTSFDVRYEPYGGRGQRQHGIDLVPCMPTPPFAMVAQCKLRTGSPFKWGDIEDDLVKTDGYPEAITHFVVFTTAAKHVSIQNVMAQGPYQHRRRNGSTFQVLVVYWEDITNLSGVPAEVLARIFPGAKQLFAPLSPESTATDFEFLPSLTTLKEFFPSIFPAEWRCLST